jgi:hypothetical protein
VVPEGQFRIYGDIACGVDELQIADEAAADIAEARVVDGRCRESDAARMILVLFQFDAFELSLAGGEGTAEGIEGDDTFN